MKRIVVEVKEDHLELLSRAKPMAAMAELIWNALDAEATEVRAEFIENELGGEESIRIRDNGHGLDYEHAGDRVPEFGWIMETAEHAERRP